MSSFTKAGGGGGGRSATVEQVGLCCICQESYDPDGERAPLIIPCGHTFCKTCLSSLPTPKKCPSCRVLIGASVASLPHNYALIEMMEALSPTQGLLTRDLGNMTDAELEAYMEERKANRAKAEGLVVQKSSIEAEITQIDKEAELLATRKQSLVQQVASLDTQIHALMNTSAPAPVKAAGGGKVGGGFVRHADEQQQRAEKIEALCSWLQEHFPDFNASAATGYATAFYNNNATTVERLAKKNKAWFVEKCGLDEDDADDILEELRQMAACMEAEPVMAALIEASSPSSSAQAVGDVLSRIANVSFSGSAHTAEEKATEAAKRRALGEKEGLIETMLAMAQSKLDEARVAEQMCRAVNNLGMDDVVRSKLGQSGACPLVLEAAAAHSSVSEVLHMSCRAICNLSIQNADNKRIFTDAGAVQFVTNLAADASNSESVREWANKAIGRLK